MSEPLLDVAAYADLVQCMLRGSPFPHAERAVPLLLGTVAQESAFTYTRQIGGGPARGYLQMEPDTEYSLWFDFLVYNPTFAAYITSRCGRGGPDEIALEYDMGYGILLARTLYFWRDTDALPLADDLEQQAALWKRCYNTVAGAGTEAQYIESYHQLVAPHYQPR
jgi:hypothetical protein